MTNGMKYWKEMTITNNTYTSDGKNRYKSRYCVKCQATYAYQCSCPNNVKHDNIMKKFHKMSMVSVEKSLEEIGLDEIV